MSDLTLEQLEKLLRAAGRDVDAVVAPVVKATALKAADTQRQHVPVRTKKTQKSIKATGPGGQPFTKTTTEAQVGPTWWVGKLLELGTATQPPRVFVAGSLDPHLPGHRKAVLDAVAGDLFKKASST